MSFGDKLSILGTDVVGSARPVGMMRLYTGALEGSIVFLVISSEEIETDLLRISFHKVVSRFRYKKYPKNSRHFGEELLFDNLRVNEYGTNI